MGFLKRGGSMIMMIRNNRMALPVVIITVTIMVILSVALISNIMQSYHLRIVRIISGIRILPERVLWKSGLIL